MNYKEKSVAIIAIGPFLLISIVAATTTATKTAQITLPATLAALDNERSARNGFANEIDVTSLVQAWVQQPDAPGLWSRWTQTKLDPQSEKIVTEKFVDPINIREVDESTNYYYNVTEWEETAPGLTLPEFIDSRWEVDNLCMHGHLVPEFILVGVVKSATTTFAAQLRQSKGILFPEKTVCNRKGESCHPRSVKEGHFFDDNVEKGSEFMAQGFPQCRTDTRLVAADATPRYMIDPTVPKVISSWYGPLKQKLKFIIILREPIARFHSDFYHAKADKWCTSLYGNNTFEMVVRKIIFEDMWTSLVGGTYNCSDRLEGSLYIPQLKRWVSMFDPRQFTIIPFGIAVGESSVRLMQDIWGGLEVPNGVYFPGQRFNGRSHPLLQYDIAFDLLEQFKTLVWAENGPLQIASFLVEHPEVTLYGLPIDHRTNKSDVFTWLTRAW